MPNMARLGKGATRKINNAIDELFDNAKARLLGPQSIQGKKLYIGFNREMSLPGIFEAGSVEEMVKPDLDILESLIRVAGAYVDAHRERTKARVVHEINGTMAEVRHNGGMARSDFRDLVNNKLSEVWADVTRNIHSVVDTELSHAKNVSVLDGIVGANLSASVGDPVVYFVVVRDNILCKECKRLHLMEDEKTPRLWYLSELGHGYHKKGDDSPKIGGLHPHCRCTLVTLLPSYGFTNDGMVKYVKRGHLELPVQRGLERSEHDYGDSLVKNWDPEEHPRDEGGKFITADEDPRLRGPETKEEIEEYEKELLEFELQLAQENAYYTPDMEMAANIRDVREMVEDGEIPADPEEIRKTLKLFRGLPADPQEAEKLIAELASLRKAQPNPLNPNPAMSLLAQRINKQARTEERNFGKDDEETWSARAALGRIDNVARLLYRYKLYSHDIYANALRYLVHRIENFDRYKSPVTAAQADEDFTNRISTALSRRPAKSSDAVPNIDVLRHFVRKNPHLVDQLLDHQKALHKTLAPHAKDGRVTLVRGLATDQYEPDVILSSYADTRDQTVGGRVTHLHHISVPLKNIWYSYDHGPTEAWKHPRRKAEDEYLVSPHDPVVVAGPPTRVGEPSAVEVKKLVPRPTPKLPRPSQSIAAKPPVIRRLASSELIKSVASIPVGPEVPNEPGDDFWTSKKYDYSHLLTPEQTAKGYSISLHYRHSAGDPLYKIEPRHEMEANLYLPMPPRKTPDEARRILGMPEHAWGPSERNWFRTHTSPQRRLVGHAIGYVQNGILTPHFNDGIDPEHRGMKLGSALYNAIFAHAHNALGAHTVKGGHHSVEAGLVHRSLSRQHGMEYKARTLRVPEKLPEKSRYHLLRRFSPNALKAKGPYQYALKDELKPN